MDFANSGPSVAVRRFFDDDSDRGQGATKTRADKLTWQLPRIGQDEGSHDEGSRDHSQAKCERRMMPWEHMHGSLMHGFKQYVIACHGKAAWAVITKAAGVAGWYGSIHAYPDQELIALIGATARYAGKPASAVLEEYGAALVPQLLGIYGAFVEPSWRTLDLLMNAESVIHRTVRLREPKAQPPRLRVCRVSGREVDIEYDSERRLCALAVGICRGVASHYQESVAIEQSECMHAGSSLCRIVVRLV